MDCVMVLVNSGLFEETLGLLHLSGKRQAFLMCVKKHRPGAHQDVQLMREWLGQCQFEYTACIDPDKMEFLEKITSFRDELNEMKDEIGCCTVTLMSHGEQGFIKMKDGEKVSLEKNL
ncbi:caspase-14-like [Suncus etruscus]|uniref:caspase-14-like n=1 Tax=Suncus etruscus TaxID=109475 RepID=UPI00210FBDB1|nr:caspase-14-like [Suncus etruscus]